MTVKNTIIDLSDYNDNSQFVENLEYSGEPIIESLIPCGEVNVQAAPGAPQANIGCPDIKYSGETVTLQSTPQDGIGPYTVTFKKEGTTILTSRLSLIPGGVTGASNPILSAPEDDTITRVYTLDDFDISSASTGTLTFSVEVSDLCPIGPMTCTSECIINVGCVAPVCNFTVT